MRITSLIAISFSNSPLIILNYPISEIKSLASNKTKEKGLKSTELIAPHIINIDIKHTHETRGKL